MKNFIFKSADADLQKMFAILDTIQRNVLYITYRVDKVLKEVTTERIDKSLQTTVDDYYETDDTEHIPDTDKESD